MLREQDKVFMAPPGSQLFPVEGNVRLSRGSNAPNEEIYDDDEENDDDYYFKEKDVIDDEFPESYVAKQDNNGQNSKDNNKEYRKQRQSHDGGFLTPGIMDDEYAEYIEYDSQRLAKKLKEIRRQTLIDTPKSDKKISRSKEQMRASTSKHSKDTDDDEAKPSQRVIRGGILSYETPKNAQKSREPSRSSQGKRSTNNSGNTKNTRHRKRKEDDEDSNPISEDDDNWGNNPSTDPSH
jgi:hypothetical protein